MEVVLSLLMKLLLLLFKYDIPEKTIVTGLDFRNAKQQMESLSEQPLSGERLIAVFQIMQKSEFRDKYIYMG